jgi:branched-chain amino acid transport system permease protein
MMNLSSAASLVMYVIVGGKSTLIGPLVGTGIVQQATNWLGTAGLGQVNLILGGVMIIFVMVFPRGVLPSLGTALTYLLQSRKHLSVQSDVVGKNAQREA